jgi:hypothetical protein
MLPLPGHFSGSYGITKTGAQTRLFFVFTIISQNLQTFFNLSFVASGRICTWDSRRPAAPRLLSFLSFLKTIQALPPVAGVQGLFAFACVRRDREMEGCLFFGQPSILRENRG